MDGDLSDLREKEVLKKESTSQKDPHPPKKIQVKKLLKNFFKKLVRMFANIFISPPSRCFTGLECGK